MHRERLYRSREDRVLFGVAGGMAEWLDQDPAVIRLLWALFVVFGGIGLIVYIIAAIVVPEEPFETPVMTPQYQPTPGADAATSGMAAGAAAAGTAAAGAAGADGAAGAAGAQGPAPVAGYAYPMSRAQYRAERRAARRAARGPSNAGVIFGLVLIVLGGWFLVRDIVPWFDDRLFWPAILIVIGVLLVLAAMRRPTQPPSA